MKTKTFFIILKGRVQGIFFRKKIKTFCDCHEIRGFVMNGSGGEVFLIVKCDNEKFSVLKDWLKNSPGLSKVHSLNFNEVKGEFDREFLILKSDNFVLDKLVAFKNLVKSIF